MSDFPRYRLTQKAYMKPSPDADGDQILAEGAEVVYYGKPGEHMEPLNDAARAAYDEAKPKPLRPEMKLPLGAAHGGEAGLMRLADNGITPGGEPADSSMLALALIRIGALEARVDALTGGQTKVEGVTAAPPPAPPLPQRGRAA